MNGTVYSEVYSILNMLGEGYIDKLPESLLNLIKKEKINAYNPVYDLNRDIDEQNISKDALAMITFFNLKYWCSEDEKNIILDILKDNEKKDKVEMNANSSTSEAVVYNEKKVPEISLKKQSDIVKAEERTYFQNIILKIRNVFCKLCKRT